MAKLSKSKIQKLNQLHKKSSNKSCIFRRERLTRQCICYLVNCLWWWIYTSESWVRWVVCYAAAQLRETFLIKGHKSKSWFVYVNSILPQYSLPSTLDLLNSELTKASWKQTIGEHINTYWVNKIHVKLEASDKSSLRFLNTKK